MREFLLFFPHVNKIIAEGNEHLEKYKPGVIFGMI